MPLGKPMILVNRYLANPIYKNFTWFMVPYATVVTRDQRTGEPYSIPMGAYPYDDDRMMIAMSYGRHVHWVENVLADGGMQLWYKGKGRLYNNPRFIPAEEGYERMAPPLTMPYKSFGTTEFLLLDQIKDAPVDAPGPMQIVAQINKSVANPVQLRYAGIVPVMGIVEHTGRKSGKSYRTPVSVMLSGGKGRIPLPYGVDTDWLKNVNAAGGASLVHRGKRFQIVDPVVNRGVLNNLEFNVRPA